jgi:hypothetical protein
VASLFLLFVLAIYRSREKEMRIGMAVTSNKSLQHTKFSVSSARGVGRRLAVLLFCSPRTHSAGPNINRD